MVARVIPSSSWLPILHPYFERTADTPTVLFFPRISKHIMKWGLFISQKSENHVQGNYVTWSLKKSRRVEPRSDMLLDWNAKPQAQCLLQQAFTRMEGWFPFCALWCCGWCCIATFKTSQPVVQQVCLLSSHVGNLRPLPAPNSVPKRSRNGLKMTPTFRPRAGTNTKHYLNSGPPCGRSQLQHSITKEKYNPCPT